MVSEPSAPESATPSPADAVFPPQDPTELFEYFLNGGRPSCPQVMWDPLTADSQREPGLTPEAEAWQAAQRALQQDDSSVSATAMDSSPKQLADVVQVSDSETEAIPPRDISNSLEAAVEVSTAGLLVQKMFYK